jgi:molybdopterin-synthase adenylyltransferase
MTSSNKESRSKPILKKKGLEKIKKSTIVIIGVGGLGSFTSILLSRMNPKKLILIDNDIVQETNLERQIIYSKKEIGLKKVTCAKQKLSEFCEIEAIEEKLTKENISKLIPKKTTLLMDCVDNNQTRIVINEYCKKNNIPWIHASVIEEIGQVALINKQEEYFSCFECFNQHKEGKKAIEIGVLNSAVGAISSIATNLAINYLVNKDITKKIIRINLTNMRIQQLNCKKGSCCKENKK